MTQQNVLKLLEKSKEPLTAKEIADKLKMQRNPVCSNLRKLREQKLVERDYKKTICKNGMIYFVPIYFTLKNKEDET